MSETITITRVNGEWFGRLPDVPEPLPLPFTAEATRSQVEQYYAERGDVVTFMGFGPEDYGTIWVCVCCMLTHANGECCASDDHGGDEREPLSAIEAPFTVAMGMGSDGHNCREECQGHYDTDDALMSGVGIGEPVFCDGSCQPKPDECDCERDTYSTSQCEGCGSYLHGERHAMTLFREV